MMPFSQSHCGVFNDIYRRSLKTGKRFSIANNNKKKRLKEHEIKTGTKKKKSEKQNPTEQRKSKFL